MIISIRIAPQRKKRQNLRCFLQLYYQYKTLANIKHLAVDFLDLQKDQHQWVSRHCKAVPRSTGWPDMQCSKHCFAAPLFFVHSTIYSFGIFAISRSCIEWGYLVEGPLHPLLLLVLKSDDKTVFGVTAPSVIQKSCVPLSKSLKIRCFCGTVVHNAYAIFLSPEHPSHDTSALKNH